MQAYAVMMGEVQPLQLTHYGLVKSIMAWLNPGVKVKPRSQINYKDYLCGIALVLA